MKSGGAARRQAAGHRALERKGGEEFDMVVYLVHPEMTGSGALCHKFYSDCREELEQYLHVATIRTSDSARTTQFTAADALIFFDRSDQNYDPLLLALIQDASDSKVEIFPVADSRTTRVPPAQLHMRQSFDIIEQLRQRNLQEASIKTVATAFARTVISRMQPTLSQERMRLFISHKRFDGEELAAAFYDQLKRRAEGAFRDLIDIRVGQDAQALIEENLLQSDAVILLDTPKAGESEWIAREIETALSLNLPVVWIKLGSDEGRTELKVKPAGKPHFDRTATLPSPEAIDSQLVDDVLNTAFRMSREASTRVFDQLRRLKAIAKSGGITLEEIDKKKFLYSIHVRREGFRYPQRPITHLVQFFGRWPKDDDEKQFLPYLDTYKEPHYGPVYDTALLVAPIPSQTLPGEGERPLYVDSLDEYVNTLENYVLNARTAPRAKKGLIISGSFPDSEPEYQQHITDAVHAFARALLDRQSVIIFGAHPTFSPLIFDSAKRRRPKDYQRAVHVYVSKYFVSEKDLSTYRKQATTFATDAVGDDLERSLTNLRRAMIADDQAVGLVAIGGKTKSGQSAPGVDEEIALAREAGLPVFLIGSAGGRTAQLGAEYSADGWRVKLNNLSPEQNEELRLSLDYSLLAKMVLDAVL
jgi:hypothetical protein